MIVVHNDGNDDDDVPNPHRQQHQCVEQHARLCKSETYQLCMEIETVLRACTDESLSVERSVLSTWFTRLKGANKSISRYVRAVAGERDRADVEMHMLKHAMLSDVLDREAAFTETLEAIAEADVGQQHDRVARAMRFVASANGSLSNLTPENSSEGASAAACVDHRDA